MATSEHNTTTVPIGLAQRLQERAEKAAAQRKPQTNGTKLTAYLDEDITHVLICFPKEQLLEQCAMGGPGNKQEGVHLTVDGKFQFQLGEHKYQFKLHLSPAWLRVDMDVAGGK